MKKNLDYYMSLKYMMTIEEIEDDGEKFFSLSHIDLPGLTIYSDSIEEGLDELKAAKKEWFAAAIKAKLNIPLPKNYSEASGRVTLRMPKTLHEELKVKSELESVSLNAYINQVINDGLRFNLTNVNIIKKTLENSFNSVGLLASLISKDIRKNVMLGNTFTYNLKEIDDSAVYEKNTSTANTKLRVIS